MVVSNQDIFGRFSGMPQNNEAEMTQLTPTRSTLSVHVLLQKNICCDRNHRTDKPSQFSVLDYIKISDEKTADEVDGLRKTKINSDKLSTSHDSLSTSRPITMGCLGCCFFFFTSVWVRKTFLKATLQLRPRKKSHSAKD